jgi:hypothetical protein
MFKKRKDFLTRPGIEICFLRCKDRGRFAILISQFQLAEKCTVEEQTSTTSNPVQTSRFPFQVAAS